MLNFLSLKCDFDQKSLIGFGKSGSIELEPRLGPSSIIFNFFAFTEKISYDIQQQFAETHLKLRNPEGISAFFKFLYF